MAGGDFSSLNKRIEKFNRDIPTLILDISRPKEVKNDKTKFNSYREMIKKMIHDITQRINDGTIICSDIDMHLSELQIPDKNGHLEEWKSKKNIIEAKIVDLKNRRIYYENVLREL